MAIEEILNAQIAEFLTEEDAEIYQKEDSTSVSLLGDAEFWRVWPELSPDRIPPAIDFLNAYTSVKNFKKNLELRYVDDPLAGRIPWPGRWRQAYVKRVAQGDVTQLAQVLRKGYASKLIDEEARLISGSYKSIEPEQVLRRQYVSLGKEYLGSILSTAIETHFVEDPVIEDEVYEGKWRIADNVPSRASDGSGIFTQTLVLGWVTTEDELPTPVLLTDAKLLLSPFIHDITSETNVYTWEYRGIDPAYAQTLRDTIALTSDVKGAEVRKVSDEIGGGSCSIRVTTESRTWAGTLSEKWGCNEVHPGFNAKQIITKYSHIPEASLAGFRTTLSTATANYKIASLQDVSSGEGFYDIVQTQQRMFIGNVTSGNGVKMQQEFVLIMGAAADVVTTKWLEVPDADLASALATLATAPGGYTVIRVGHNYAGVGSATIVRVMIKDGSGDELEMRIDFPSFEGERKTYAYMGLSIADANTKYTTLQTTSEANYKVVNVTKSEGKFGTITVQQVISRIFEGSVSDSNGVDVKYDLAIGLLALVADSKIVTTVWLEVSDANIDTSLTTLETAPEGYTVTGLSVAYDGIGSATITRIMVTKEDATAIELGINWPTFDSERKTYAYLGLDKTSADTKYTELQTEVAEGYKVDSVTIQAGTAGSLTVVQQISKVQVSSWSSVTHRHDYTSTFGLVTAATTVYLNIPHASIGAVKTGILAIGDIIVLDVSDDDVGEGKANITYTWRSKVAAPRSLGTINSSKNSQFHKETQDRLWIDINLEDVDSLKNAVALAMAGTAPYEVAEGAEIRGATGEDAGDKTGRITQRVVKEGTPDPAEYSMQESFNPHGLQEAVMIISVKEYPEVAYTNVGTIFALLQTFLGDPMKGRIQVSMNANGTFAMRGLKEGTPDWANITPDYVKVATSNKDLIGESKVELATGVPVADAAAIVEAAEADADHVIDDIRMTERGQGEAAIEKRQTKKSETAVTVRVIPALGIQRAAQERTWPLVLDANLAAVWTAALTEGVVGDYVLQYRQRRILGNGMYEVSNRVEAATEVEVAAFTSEDRADITNVAEHKQDSDAIPDAANSEGVNVSVAGQLNALNKYNYNKSTSTAHSQEVSYSYLDRNGTTYAWAGTLCTQAQYDAAIATAALDVTTDNSVEKRTTSFEGLFNYSIIKRPVNTIYHSRVSLSYGPYTAVSLQWNSDYSQYRTKTLTYTIYYNTTDLNNQNDCTGGGPGSKMWRDGYQWKCIRVTSIAFGTWTNAETINFPDN